jgi:hypothetical protein
LFNSQTHDNSNITSRLLLANVIKLHFSGVDMAATLRQFFLNGLRRIFSNGAGFFTKNLDDFKTTSFCVDAG